MELVFNRNRGGHFLGNLFRDYEDSSFGLSDSLLGAAKGNRSVASSLVGAFLDVNLSVSRVLNLVDGRAATSKDAGN